MTELPALLKELPDDGNWSDARAAVPPEAYDSGAAPKVITTDKPAELILFEGEPALQDVPGTALQWASNSESDVFFDKTGKQWYVLLSGRWFRAATLDGPWTFATPDLPADFRNIPGRCALLCRAVVRAGNIGERGGAAKGQHSHDGTRRGRLDHANDRLCRRRSVRADRNDRSFLCDEHDRDRDQGRGALFLLQDGVWFMADNPNGPWQLAREVPEAIYQIPPSSPLYNATYVRVYETEPDAVWYGYTMGYLYGFPAWDTFVYGTGWSYPPYWYNWARLRVPDLLSAARHLGPRGLLQSGPGHVWPLWLCLWSLSGDCRRAGLESAYGHLCPCRSGLGTARLGRIRRRL